MNSSSAGPVGKAPQRRGMSAMLRRLAMRQSTYALAVAGLLAVGTGAYAAGTDIYKAPNNTDMGTSGSFVTTSGGTTPAPTPPSTATGTNGATPLILVFDSTDTQASTSVRNGGGTSATFAVDGIVLSNPGGPVTISSNSGTATIGSSGINMSAATTNLTFAVSGTSGSLRIGPGTNAGISETWSVNSGSTLTMNDGVTTEAGTNTLTLAGGNSGNGSVVFNGVVGSGSGSVLNLILNGANVTMNAANTFGGSTTLSSGTLALGNNSALQNTTLTDNTSGALTFATGIDAANIGALAGSGNIALTDASSAAVTIAVGSYNASGMTYSGVLSGTGGLTKYGSGTLTLSGANTNSGTTTIGGGTLTLTNTNANTSAVVNAFGTLSLGTNGSLGGTITLNGTAANLAVLNMGAAGTNFPGNSVFLATGATGEITSASLSNGFAGTISSTGTDATSTLQIGSNVSFSNATPQLTNFYGTAEVISGGSLRFSTTTAPLTNGGSNTTFKIDSGGTINTRNGGTNIALGALTGAGSVTGASTVAGTVTYTIGGNNASTAFSGVISNGTVGTTAITKTGTGTLTLNGTGNSYSGLTTLNAGTLNINGMYALGGANYSGLTFNGGSLQYVTSLGTTYGGGDISNFGGAKTVTISSGGATVDTNGNAITYASPIGNGGTGGLTVASTTAGGSLTLSGVNTYTGATKVNSGTLAVNGSTATGSAVTVASGATLSGTGTVNGTVAENGTINAGTVGAIGTLNTGALTFGSGSTLGFDINATTSDLLNISGNLTATSPINVTANVLTTPTAASYELVGFTGLGTGTTLSDFNLTNGPAGYALSLTGTVLDLVQTASVTTNAAAAYWTGGQGTVWNTNNSNQTNFATAASGGTAALPGASSNVTFTASSASNYTSTTLGASTTINSLTLGVGAAAGNPITIAADGSTLTINATNVNGNTAGNGITDGNTGTTDSIAAPVALGNSQTWTVSNSGNTLSVSGTVSDGTNGATTLTKAGGGTLTLSGSAPNTYSGGTTVSGGTLNLNAIGADGSGKLTVNAGGTVVLSAQGADSSTDPDINGGTLQVTANDAMSHAAPVSIENGGILQNANTGANGSGGLGNGTAPTNNMQTAGVLTVGRGTSILDFGAGNTGAIFNFADSHNATWTGTLDVLNWAGNYPTSLTTMNSNGTYTGGTGGGGLDQLIFGNSQYALTAAQLGDIQFFSGSTIGPSDQLGPAAILNNGGVVAAPEPKQTAMLALMGLGLGGLILRARKHSKAEAA